MFGVFPITTWTYTTGSVAVNHLNPMTQDFHAGFGLGGGDHQHIAVADEGGFALAAIQRLNIQNPRLDKQNRTVKVQLSVLEKR
ncbi:hypothetical protein E7T09_06265 [Deinococcus sp. KSM4-11]|uniref:hypothetical protein n=1 Tax=Deinococcus sp. KSM4-11 TaxID=2568654 RepID=UPI0010A53048|nr:hypothetical protein [Deinococcus sp. KSM4-11]THF88778.1 hypothetical protein E7T09_06265 [Deinococcus sp. KSM4-11]